MLVEDVLLTKPPLCERLFLEGLANLMDEAMQAARAAVETEANLMAPAATSPRILAAVLKAMGAIHEAVVERRDDVRGDPVLFALTSLRRELHAAEQFAVTRDEPELQRRLHAARERLDGVERTINADGGRPAEDA